MQKKLPAAVFGERTSAKYYEYNKRLLASCYQSCLALAVANGVQSIAFPSISMGIYHFPLDEAAKITIRTAQEFVAEHPGELDVIKRVLFDDQTFECYKKELKRWDLLRE